MPDYAVKESEIRFILPFTTLGPNRFVDFTKEMEMAAILYLAETNRKRGEGHILKIPDEKIVFITEAHYPLWLIPFDGSTVIFDGLGITSHRFSFDTIPDIQILNESIQEGQKSTESYTATLARNADFFKNPSRDEKTIEGLIAAPDLIEDLTTYLPQMEEIEKSFAAETALAPTINYHETQKSIEQLSNLKRNAHKDVEDMDASIKILNTTTVERTRAVHEEIRRIQDRYDERIEEIRQRVRREVSQIQSEYRRETAKTSKMFKDSLQRLRKDQIKLQKMSRHLRTEAKLGETRARSERRRKGKRTGSSWTLKLKRIKKELPKVNKELKKTIREIQSVEVAQKLELAQAKTECDARIEAANRPFISLRASREAETTMKQQEIATLEEMTLQITSQIREVADTRRADLAEFDRLTMPRKRKTSALVYLPFYLVRYEKENQKRYVVYSPSFASNLGTLTKMKGTLGATKMKSLLQPHSEAIASFLNQLVTRVGKDPMLEREITDAGIQHSILLSTQLRKGVKKGLEELEKEGWISRSELQAFSKLLYVYG